MQAIYFCSKKYVSDTMFPQAFSWNGSESAAQVKNVEFYSYSNELPYHP